MKLSNKNKRPIDTQKFKSHIKVKNVGSLILSVSKALSLPKDEVVGLSRKRKFIDARIISVGLILTAYPNMKLKDIGTYFNRHHSTIMSARDNFNGLLGNSDFRKKLAEVIKFIN